MAEPIHRTPKQIQKTMNNRLVVISRSRIVTAGDFRHTMILGGRGALYAPAPSRRRDRLSCGPKANRETR
jgi:hypothetical protein